MPICGSEVAEKKWTVAGLAGEGQKKEHILEVGLDGKFAVPKGCHVPFLDWR